MINYILYIVLVTADGQTHVMKHEGLSNVVCQSYLSNIDHGLKHMDTTQYESVKTGCLKRKITKVQI